MGINCETMLPDNVRLYDVMSVIGVSVGLPNEMVTLGSDEYLKVSNIKSFHNNRTRNGPNQF